MVLCSLAQTIQTPIRWCELYHSLQVGSMVIVDLAFLTENVTSGERDARPLVSGIPQAVARQL